MTTHRPIHNGDDMYGACFSGERERVQAHGEGGGDLDLADGYGRGACSGL